ncbi:MAG TPA: hypothetical protein VFN57_17565 [Thermomicrobiaceae bacterium]|nr:hypothetical protein [Thermomicrobiaceae bacterium]
MPGGDTPGPRRHATGHEAEARPDEVPPERDSNLNLEESATDKQQVTGEVEPPASPGGEPPREPNVPQPRHPSELEHP